MAKKKTNVEEHDVEQEETPVDVSETTAESEDSNVEENITPIDVPEEVPDPVEIRLLRLQADFDNYRKRMVRERQEWAQRAAEDLVNDLLPVLDHYEMGLQTARSQETDAAVLHGFEMVHGQLISALKKSGLDPIDAEGSPFDPHLHEAITYLPSDDHDADLIMNQTRRGYKLGSKLLRPSQVVVSSGPAAGAPSDDEAGDA